MQKWILAALLLVLAQVTTLYSLDGGASYTIGVAAALILTALTFSWAPQQARGALLLAAVVFAIFVAGRLDALPAKIVTTMVLLACSAWALGKARIARSIDDLSKRG